MPSHTAPDLAPFVSALRLVALDLDLNHFNNLCYLLCFVFHLPILNKFDIHNIHIEQQVCYALFFRFEFYCEELLILFNSYAFSFLGNLAFFKRTLFDQDDEYKLGLLLANLNLQSSV